VNGVNANIKGKMITLEKSCARLEIALQKLAGKLAAKVRKCKGSRHRAKLRACCTNFLVGDGE
jgi:hypothetical protein